MKKIFFFGLFLLIYTTLFSQQTNIEMLFQKADSLHSEGEYVESKVLFKKLLDDARTEKGTFFYNRILNRILLNDVISQEFAGFLDRAEVLRPNFSLQNQAYLDYIHAEFYLIINNAPKALDLINSALEKLNSISKNNNLLKDRWLYTKLKAKIMVSHSNNGLAMLPQIQKMIKRVDKEKQPTIYYSMYNVILSLKAFSGVQFKDPSKEVLQVLNNTTLAIPFHLKGEYYYNLMIYQIYIGDQLAYNSIKEQIERFVNSNHPQPNLFLTKFYFTLCQNLYSKKLGFQSNKVFVDEVMHYLNKLQEKDWELYSEIYRHTAYVHYDSLRYAEAAQSQEKALTYMKKSINSNEFKLTKLYAGINIYQYKYGNIGRSYSAGKKALRSIEELQLGDKQLYSSYYHLLNPTIALGHKSEADSILSKLDQFYQEQTPDNTLMDLEMTLHRIKLNESYFDPENRAKSKNLIEHYFVALEQLPLGTEKLNVILEAADLFTQYRFKEASRSVIHLLELTIKELPFTSQLAKAQLYHFEALNLAYFGEKSEEVIEEIIAKFDASHKAFRKIRNPPLFALDAFELAIEIFQNFNHSTVPVNYSHKLEDFSKRYGNLPAVYKANVKLIKAHTYFLSGIPENQKISKRIFHDVLPLMEDLDDPRIVVNFLCGLSGLYVLEDSLDLALEFAEKAHKVALKNPTMYRNIYLIQVYLAYVNVYNNKF